MSKKNKKRGFIFIILILLMIGGIVYYRFNSRFIYNEDNAIGNTTGNLNNGGLFCEYKGTIYFANPNDNNTLYSMNSDCTNAKKLNNDSIASINVCGNYIYYVRNNFNAENAGMIFRGQLFGVYRTNLDGQNCEVLYDHLSGIVSIYGNYMYYQHYDDKTAFNLYKIKIDGTGNTKLSDTEYNPSSIYNNKIYFSNITNSDHNICTLDTKTNSVSTYYEGNTYLCDMEGAYLYYIDISKSYALVRLSTGNKTVELLTDGRCINYNLYGNKIFYQIEGGDHPGIYRMNADGSHKELIASGNFTNIHCTSSYTFFQYYEDQGTLYRVPTTGTITNIEEITIKQC